MLFIIIISSCGTSEKPETLFTLLDPKDTGIDFSNNLTDTEEFNIVEYLNYYNGAGVAVGDINNDGLSDLYFASNQESNRLFLNKGDFDFKDITKKAGVECPGGWKTGVSMADVNSDGWLDIYVCQVGDYKSVQGENHLYINNGDLTFTDRTEEYGLQFKGFSTQSLFFDFDNDGDLDMFLLNHAIHTPGSYGNAAIIRYSRDAKTGDKLYRQDVRDGKPYFTNVTEMAGIFSSRIGYGLGVSAGDVNNDGFVDLYISNDFHENDYLYLNNGNGTFTETIRLAMGHTTKSSMGNDMADFNNDGLLDIFSLDMYPEDPVILKKSAGEEMMEVFDLKEDLGYYYQLTRNALQLNRGKGVFSEIAAYSGVHATDWSWAPLFFDADNDGLKDLFISNGIPMRPNDLDYLQFVEDNAAAINTTGSERISSLALVSMMPSDTIANYAYKNNGDLTFSNHATEWGLGQRAFSNGSVYADLDNDGDLDLVVANLNANCFVYRNNADVLTDNHYLKVKLNGPEHNRFGIGVRVEIKAGGKLIVQQSIPARGAMSCVDQMLTFGIGNSSIIDTLNVFWPGGTMEQLTNVQVDQTLTFEFENATRPNFKMPKQPEPVFNDYTDSLDVYFSHQEKDFSDFDNLPLLPEKLSNEGPCIVVADVNGDQLPDIYIGGAAGQPGSLFLQTSNGKFIVSEQSVFFKPGRRRGNRCFVF
jgi:enediyne biosynthesis protein E4